MRLELTRPNGHYPLKVARLPIPPLLHIISKTFFACPEQDSNLHVSQHSHLKRARLPFRHLGFRLRAENEARTRDPNLGKVVLYQLSYFRVFGIHSLVLLSLPRLETLSLLRQGCALPTELFPHYFIIWFLWLRSLCESKLSHSLAQKFRIIS